MNIIIAGDLVPTISNYNYFKTNIIDNLDEDFKKKWFSSDFRVFNLECPITDSLIKFEKYGPNLSCQKDLVNGIKKLNPSLLLLANNHIKDYGIKGIEDTINLLNQDSIPHTGIINTKNDFNSGYILEKDNIKVGIYNFSDNEFSTATSNEKGVRGISLLENYKEIKELRLKVDFLIIAFHGGKEYYQYQSPWLENFTQLLVEYGADIVICQHSHCIGTKKIYNGSTIIYGQGNFIFDDGNNELEKESLLLDIKFDKKKYSINYIPICKYNGLIKISSNDVIENFNIRSNNIENFNFKEKKFADFSIKKLNNYLSVMSGDSVLKKIINKFFVKNYYIKSYSKKSLIRILNILECEAHREVVICAIKEYLRSDKDNENGH